MARTAVTITALTAEAQNAFTLAAAGVAIDATNHHSVTVPAGVDARELVLFFVHTTSSSKAATVKAGVNPPSVRTGTGDLTVTMGDGSTTAVLALVPLDGSRFMQSDGTINIDIASGMTGRIACFQIPRTL